MRKWGKNRLWNSIKTNASKEQTLYTPPKNMRELSRLKWLKRHDKSMWYYAATQLFLRQLGEFYYGQDNRYHCINVKFLECDNNYDQVGERPCSKKNAEAFCSGMSCLQVTLKQRSMLCVSVCIETEKQAKITNVVWGKGHE